MLRSRLCWQWPEKLFRLSLRNESLSSYQLRLVSNLTFLSEIIERVVGSQLSKYLIVDNLNETL